jgi:hypothetical protein
MVFDTDGSGKTAGTGAFFTESLRGASTYSGTMREAKPVDAQMVVENPDQYGFTIRQEGDEWIATDPDGNEWASSDRDQALTELASDWVSETQSAQDGNYAVYLSIQNPKIIDAGGQNWDSIGAEPEYFVQNEDGDVIEYFTSKEDAEIFVDQNEEEYGFLEVIEEMNSDLAASTDDLVREARDQGYDGVIFENITDEGPFGQGYGWDNKVYVAFSPTQIKSVNNRGTFDPADPRILFQFAGPQAQTADIHALATARDRIAAGANPEVVRRETGWFRGPDLKWRYEITDEDARINLADGLVWPCTPKVTPMKKMTIRCFFIPDSCLWD